MIEINLLPQEMRKKGSPLSQIFKPVFNIQKLPVLSIAAGLYGLLIIAQILVIILNILASSSLTSLNKKFDSIAIKKREADALRAKGDAITKRINAIDELMGKRFSWAKILNALSDSMTPGIWLSDLEYDDQPVADAKPAKDKAIKMPGRLLLNGYAAGIGEQGLGLVGKFIKSLKENAAFSADIGSIDLIASKSDKAEEQEVMNFKISCVFK